MSTSALEGSWPIAALCIATLVLVASLLGLLLRARGGRARSLADQPMVDLAELGLSDGGEPRAGGTPGALGGAGAVVQFSTEYCSRCPGVRRVLSELTDEHAGLRFQHIDVTAQTDLVAKYRLTQTPTVLMIDAHGRPQARLTGALTRAQLADAIAALTGGSP